MIAMLLAESLLEGYSGNGWSNFSDNSTVIDPISYVQEACIEFLTESYNIQQQYYVADIVGQSKVITEGADPQVLLEGNLSSMWQKIKKAIKTLIDKLRAWVKKMIAWIKGKFKKKKESEKIETAEKVFVELDAGEVLKKPTLALPMHSSSPALLTTSSTSSASSSPSSVTRDRISARSERSINIGNPNSGLNLPMNGEDIYLMLVPYDVSTGNDTVDKMLDAIADVYSGFMSMSAEDVGADGYATEFIVKKLETGLGCKIADISNTIMTSYGATKSPVRTAISKEELRNAIDLYTVSESNLTRYVNEVDALTKSLDAFIKRMDSGVMQSLDPLTSNAMLAAIQFITQTQISVCNISIEVWNKINNQALMVVNSIDMAAGTSVHEGTEYDEGQSDPPSDDDDMEGAACESYQCYPTENPVIEGFIENLKETFKNNRALVKEASEIFTDIGSTRGLKEEGKIFKNAAKAARKKDYDTAIKGYDEYIKTMNSLKTKLGRVKGKYSSQAVQGVLTSINTEIELTKSYLEDVKSKKDGKRVTESSSIWEQASNYL